MSAELVGGGEELLYGALESLGEDRVRIGQVGIRGDQWVRHGRWE